MMSSPAAQRNKAPIAEILGQYLGRSAGGNILEIASGDGTHVRHLASAFPHWTWQPTELEPQLVQRIMDGLNHSNSNSNILKPFILDVSDPMRLNDVGGPFQAMLNVNMTHISPFSATRGLFAWAGSVLDADKEGRLFMYGPFSENGLITPDSNVRFDAMLKSSDPSWGIRDLAQLTEEAASNNLRLEAAHEMPANNKIYVFRKY